MNSKCATHILGTRFFTMLHRFIIYQWLDFTMHFRCNGRNEKENHHLWLINLKWPVPNRPSHVLDLYGIIKSMFWYCTDTTLMYYIWDRSRNYDCLVTWFCYKLIAIPDNKRVTVSWPDPYAVTRKRRLLHVSSIFDTPDAYLYFSLRVNKLFDIAI